MARECQGRFKKAQLKNWKKTTKDRRTWREGENPQRVVVPNDDDDDEYRKHVRFYLHTPNSVTFSMFTVSAFIFLMLTPSS